MDLTLTEAQSITRTIRRWVKDLPINEIQRAYEGRIWRALGYDNWGQWCNGELNGFKLPMPQRRTVVDQLAESGMSKRSIAEVAGVSEWTVRNDLKSTASNLAVGKTLGQDGKLRKQPAPQRESAPIENVMDAALDSAHVQDEAVSIRNQSRMLRERMEALVAQHQYSGDPYTIECLNEAADNCIATSAEVMQFTLERAAQ